MPDASHAAQFERYLADYLSNMMSTLLAVPDNPEQGVLYLLTGCLNIIQKHINWDNNDHKFSLLLNSLAVLSALKQENHLYGVDQIEANDTLYASDVKYFREVNVLVESVVNDLYALVRSQVKKLSSF